MSRPFSHEIEQRAMKGAKFTTRQDYFSLLERWRNKEPVCNRAAGLDNAKCILPPGHTGAHEGPGNDGWGPKHVAWSHAR